MKQVALSILLILSQLHDEVASDESFLHMENLETYTADVLKICDSINRNNETETLIKTFFAKINDFINDLAKKNIDLRFDTESISFSSYWEIPREIHDDLNEILIASKNINEFFESYYIDFLDGFYTKRLINHFINISIYPAQHNLYSFTTQINEIIFSQQPLKENEDNFFDKITYKLNRNFNQLCESHSTRQQFLIALYSYMIKTQFRAFLMFSSAYKLNYILSNDSVSHFLNQLRRHYLSTWSYYYLGRIQLALKKTSTDYYDCRVDHYYNYGLENLYAIELSPTIIDYQKNKVVTGVEFGFRNGFLSLILHDGTLEKGGKISSKNWCYGRHEATRSRSSTYSFPKDRNFDYKLPEVEYVHKSFWKNISFLQTTVPKNHVIVGANFEVLKFDPNSTTTKKVLYIRLHCAQVNITAGKIDTSKIVYTKVWTKNDPELQKLSEINKNQPFKPNRQSVYKRILVNVSHSITRDRWRREPPLNSYIDSTIIRVYPRLPITGVGIWKNKHGRNSHHLSLKISTIDISSRIKSRF